MKFISFKEFCLRYFNKAVPPLPEFHDGGIVIGPYFGRLYGCDYTLPKDYFKNRNNSKISFKSIKSVTMRNDDKILGVSADFIINDDLLAKKIKEALK